MVRLKDGIYISKQSLQRPDSRRRAVCARWEECRRSDGRWALQMVSPGRSAMRRWAWHRWTRFPDRWASGTYGHCGMARWPFAPVTSMIVQRKPRWPPTASPLAGCGPPAYLRMPVGCQLQLQRQWQRRQAGAPEEPRAPGARHPSSCASCARALHAARRASRL